jgi:hypothetical protein
VSDRVFLTEVTIEAGGGESLDVYPYSAENTTDRLVDVFGLDYNRVTGWLRDVGKVLAAAVVEVNEDGSLDSVRVFDVRSNEWSEEDV